jgi:isocitrate dehydrogenase
LSDSNRIRVNNGKLTVPDHVTIPYIEGDGIGVDIWPASQKVWDAAIEKTYGGKKKILWKEVFAGEKGNHQTGDYLPEATLKTFQEYAVGIKGPLTTPVGGGIRSLNVAIRQALDLYTCIRPMRYFEGIHSPVKKPENMHMIVFRENTEDVYAGIEYESGSPEAKKLRDFLLDTLKSKPIHKTAALGIKPVSEFGSKRLIKMAYDYALKRNRPSVTLVHKGNIMKYTEGAFMEWGYQLAAEKYRDHIVTEEELGDKWNEPQNRVVLKNRIADAFFQQALLRPGLYDVIATTNLNGDYLSDALAAQVGGIGIAPGANVGDSVAVFEATHGTAPKYAGKNMSNPSSLILSGVMMFEHMGWDEVAKSILDALGKAILQKRVTYDLARYMENPTELSSSDFAGAIIDNL